jgi:hypothetical protein
MQEELCILSMVGILIIVNGRYMYLVWFRPEKIRAQAESRIKFEETTLLPYPWRKPFIKQRKALIKSPIWIWYMRLLYMLITAFFVCFLLYILYLFNH